jgi:hypothetical protein
MQEDHVSSTDRMSQTALPGLASATEAVATVAALERAVKILRNATRPLH